MKQEQLVCKLIRLGKDGDKFKPDLVAKVLRTNAKISRDYYNEFNAQMQVRGQMYVIDEEATKLRNDIIQNDNKPKRTYNKKTEDN